MWATPWSFRSTGSSKVEEFRAQHGNRWYCWVGYEVAQPGFVKTQPARRRFAWSLGLQWGSAPLKKDLPYDFLPGPL